MRVFGMIIDAHIHCSGNEEPDDVLRALDEAGVEKAVLLAPFLGDYSMHDGDSLRSANRYLSRLVAGREDRLMGFAVINPALDKASADLRDACELGLRGQKPLVRAAREKFELNESVSQTSELLSCLTKTRYHDELSIETCDGDLKKRWSCPSSMRESKSSHGRRVGVAGWDGAKEKKISNSLPKHDNADSSPSPRR